VGKLVLKRRGAGLDDAERFLPHQYRLIDFLSSHYSGRAHSNHWDRLLSMNVQNHPLIFLVDYCAFWVFCSPTTLALALHNNVTVEAFRTTLISCTLFSQRGRITNCHISPSKSRSPSFLFCGILHCWLLDAGKHPHSQPISRCQFGGMTYQ
jgi:hypothetical protein